MRKILKANPRYPALTALAMIASLCVGFAAPAYAQTEQDGSFNLTTITCWDLTSIEVDERVPALMMLYGYVAGSNDLAAQNGADIAPALERVGKLCSANPDMYVVAAIERVVLTPAR